MLTGKRIFITGGSDGIGFGCAKTAVKYGATVAITGRNQDKLNKAKAELGDRCFAYVCDATDEEKVKEVVAKAAEDMGGLDGAVNNVGNAESFPVFAMDSDGFDRTLKICLYSCMYALREETSYMVNHGIQGSIVNISSLNGHAPGEYSGAYNAAKAAIDNYTRTAAIDLGSFGIRVNAVAPGFTATQLIAMIMDIPEVKAEVMSHTPLKRYGTPEDMGEAACFLLSDRSSFITGNIINVDGGMTITAYPDTMSIFKKMMANQ